MQIDARWKPSPRTALTLSAQDVRRVYGNGSTPLALGQPAAEHAVAVNAALSYMPPLRLFRSAVTVDLSTSLLRRQSDAVLLNAHDAITTLTLKVTS